MALITKGTCKGLPTGCEGGPFSYPDDIDENDNLIPVVLVNGLCTGCIEVANDVESFELANAPDFA